MVKNIFNIPSGYSPVDVLAQKLSSTQNTFELADTLILLPNRRACRELRDAFVRANGMQPTILPKMMPLGDIDEDEIFFAEANATAAALPPAISPTERLLLFIRLIAARPQDLTNGVCSLAQAVFMANELGNLLNTAENEELSFSALQNLVPEEYAVHWQKILDFLKIITEFFPKILQERGYSDTSQRQINLLKLQNNIWKETPPAGKIIIAGTTGAFPAMRELIKTVSQLENGTVYLNDIDRCLDENSWQQIDESHPQFEIKQLLDFLEIDRSQIEDILPPHNIGREKLISELMRPATTTELWRNLDKNSFDENTLNGVHLICCREQRQESLAIAAIMRHTLEQPEKTAALITSDRNLARRVANELKRWNITVDDSAGRPLTQTPVGLFLRLVAKTCETNFETISFIGLLKHPLSTCNQSNIQTRQQIRDYEKIVLRKKQSDPILEEFVNTQKQKLQPLYELLRQPQADFKELLTCHIKVAESLAASADKEGAENLWRGDDGEAAASFFADLLENSSALPTISHHQYSDFIEALMSSHTVRPKYGTHPRLKILGPIEARLSGFDTVIIGGVNEGTMPSNAPAGVWMSRPMKRDFGFPQPEKNIGILAHDFAHLLAQKEVYLTRSERVNGAPTVKSRWWMRLETVLDAAEINIEQLYQNIYAPTADFLNTPEQYRPIKPPAPKPPLKARPRELWASAIENLMRDPYIIYARYILKLRPLDDIVKKPDIMDFGIIVHGVLETLNRRYPHQLPANAKEIMSELSAQALQENGIDEQTQAFWKPNIEKMIDWVLKTEKNYRPQIAKVNCEISGQYSFESFGGTFTIGAKADRIDETVDGKLNIIDYKTGNARSQKEMQFGYAPQLPIEGIIAQNGGFPNLSTQNVESLRYWRLGKKEINLDKNIDNVLENNLQNIKKLIEVFDNPEKSYPTQPNPKYAPTYSDYEHLSRIKEWGINDNRKD